MNLLSLLVELTDADPELLHRLSPRRGVLDQLSRLSGKVAAATVPLALGSMLRGAYASPQTTVTDSLTLAYTLEVLENTFYSQALGLVASAPVVAPALLPATLRPGIVTIQSHEQQHVAFLSTVLQASGIALPGALRFDLVARTGRSRPFSPTYSATRIRFCWWRSCWRTRACEPTKGSLMPCKATLPPWKPPCAFIP